MYETRNTTRWCMDNRPIKWTCAPVARMSPLLFDAVPLSFSFLAVGVLRPHVVTALLGYNKCANTIQYNTIQRNVGRICPSPPRAPENVTQVSAAVWAGEAKLLLAFERQTYQLLSCNPPQWPPLCRDTHTHCHQPFPCIAHKAVIVC